MRILVIDDARDMRIIIQQMLIKLGHEVDIAIDGQHGWDMLQVTDYEVVVSDWMMPKLDGLELCKRIRKGIKESTFSHYIYFILLTGMSGKVNLISGVEAGVDDFATKPANIDELYMRLRSAERVIDREYALAKSKNELQKIYGIIETDLKNAAITQTGLLPAPLEHDKVSASWLFKPAIYVGGDTFNYFCPSPDILVFFSIDISGHGISSAMLSMSLQSSLALTRGLYGGPISQDRLAEIPEIFANNINKLLFNHNSEHYLTMIFGIIDSRNNKLHFVQAGHPYPFWVDQQKNSIEPISVNGFPVGLFEGAEYETHHLSYKKGDKFILYSDGISENKSEINGKYLENENLTEHFETIKSLSADEMIEEISTKWISEEQMEKLPDDVSVLIFEFN